MALNVRLDAELHQRAVQQAESQHQSLNSLINEALSEYLDRRDHRARVGDSMAKMLPRYSDTLRRLGE